MTRSAQAIRANSSLSSLYARRGLAVELVRSELRASTAETRLGWFWWLLDPLVMMGIYWLFFVVIIGRDRYEAYPIFVGCALLGWKHFSATASQSVRVLRKKQALIKSVPFPTIVLPIAQVSSNFLYFLFGFCALVIAAVLMDRPVTLAYVQLLPLMVLQVALVSGAALLLASFGALIKDLESFLSHFMRVGWYLSPGIYGLDMVADRLGGSLSGGAGQLLLDAYILNPFAVLFTGYRLAVHDPGWMPASYWLILGAWAVGLLVVGYFVYNYFDRRVIKFL